MLNTKVLIALITVTATIASYTRASISIVSSSGSGGDLTVTPTGARFSTTANSSRSGPPGGPYIYSTSSASGSFLFAVVDGRLGFPSNFFLGNPYINTTFSFTELSTNLKKTYQVNDYRFGSITGSVSGDPGTYRLDYSSQGAIITSTTGNGFVSLDLQFIPLPEPTSATALAFVLGTLGRRRRRGR